LILETSEWRNATPKTLAIGIAVRLIRNRSKQR